MALPALSPQSPKKHDQALLLRDYSPIFTLLFMDKIILPQAEIYFIEDHILKIDMLHNEEMELEQMKEVVHSGIKLANGKPYCLLADLRRSIGSSTNEARQYAADHSFPPNKIADAIIIGSLAKKLMANFYIQFNKPKSPTRIFNSESSAIKWLNSKLKDGISKNIYLQP
jgi:hypothetical protein